MDADRFCSEHSGQYTDHREILSEKNNVHSMMVEVNRKLYMDEKTGNKIIRHNKVKFDIAKVLDQLLDL